MTASSILAEYRSRPSSAERILVLLGILNRFALCYDSDGKRSAEGHRIYQNYFTGKQALFSDETDTNKRVFRNELTFPHPEQTGANLFCPYHGKERHSTLRLHFSWPIRFGEPVYVVYVGQKIAKR